MMSLGLSLSLHYPGILCWVGLIELDSTRLILGQVGKPSGREPAPQSLARRSGGDRTTLTSSPLEPQGVSEGVPKREHREERPTKK